MVEGAAYVFLWVGEEHFYSFAAGRVDARWHCIFAKTFSSTRRGLEVVFQISCRALNHEIWQ